MKMLELAMRLFHESKYHESSIFVTFTYNDDNLPRNSFGFPTLRKSDFQDFMKRLRKELSPRKVRVFYCGEYGGQVGRPHYHAILFGMNTDDLKVIEKKWNKGFVSVSDLTLGRCYYTAKYILKNEVYSYEYCISRNIEPQFVQGSNRPGIGFKYLSENSGKFLSELQLKFRGKCVPFPRYYYKKLKEMDEFISYRMNFNNFSHRLDEIKKDIMKPLREMNSKRLERLCQIEKNKLSELKLKGI